MVTGVLSNKEREAREVSRERRGGVRARKRISNIDQTSSHEFICRALPHPPVALRDGRRRLNN
jgi:hypothetical protein